VNPMVGCRMQQACGVRAEKTVEVGWNDKDGTSLAVAAPGRRVRETRRTRRVPRNPGVDARNVCRRRGDLWTTP
jgi:hypothetical protein